MLSSSGYVINFTHSDGNHFNSSKNFCVSSNLSSEYGGAIFLGLNGLSIKAHGNSDSNGIKNAIKVANRFAEINFVEELKKVIDIDKEETN